MGQKFTHDTYVEEIQAIHGNRLTIISPFTGTKHPITYVCNTCKNPSEISQAGLLTSTRYKQKPHVCRHCFWEKKHDGYRNQARQKVLAKVATFPTLTVLRDYRQETDQKLVLEMHCQTCEHVWSALASNISNRNSKFVGCPNCYKQSEAYKKERSKGILRSVRKRKKIAKENFFAYLKENPQIQLAEPYLDTHTPILFTCLICKEPWKTAPNHIMHSKSGCPYCNSGQFEAKQNYVNDVKKAHGDSVSVLEPYENATTKILHNCTKCNEPWHAAPSSVKRGSGCPRCNVSRGENAIALFLKQHQIPFIPQWREHACKHYKTLPFDFYLPNHHVVIEFQGIQHEQFVPFFHKKEEAFTRQQQRDQLKKTYCAIHNIQFFEIWYHEMDTIEKKLETLLQL